jgi:hypothetical protein
MTQVDCLVGFPKNKTLTWKGQKRGSSKEEIYDYDDDAYDPDADDFLDDGVTCVA